MQYPLVSVIVPVYNSENYLKESIDSVLNQTYENIEIIIVNDGSTDYSWDVLCTKYSANKKIKLFKTPNKGQSAACNFGFGKSTGDYIKFFDSDDILNPLFIENQLALINEDDSIISSAKWGRFYNDDIKTFKLCYESVWRDMKPIDWITEALASGSNMLQCALWLIPRNILLQSGLWNEDLHVNNDFDFFIRVLLASQEIRFSEQSILYYRSGLSNSLSQRKNKTAFTSAVSSNLLGTESILKYEDSERTRKACAINLRGLLFQVYPQYPGLSETLQAKIKELGAVSLIYGGRPSSRFLSKVFGWKLTRWVGYKVVQKIRPVLFKKHNKSFVPD